jgi:hypothetical protein
LALNLGQARVIAKKPVCTILPEHGNEFFFISAFPRIPRKKGFSAFG